MPARETRISPSCVIPPADTSVFRIAPLAMVRVSRRITSIRQWRARGRRFKVDDLESCAEGLAIGPDKFRETRQDNHGGVPFPDVQRCDHALGFPERVQQSHERFALPGEIVQHEQLIARVAGRAKHRFVLGLVLRQLKAGGSFTNCGNWSSSPLSARPRRYRSRFSGSNGPVNFGRRAP